jgi:hypothetical protein
VDNQSRYIYLLAAFLLPALAVGGDAIGRRWRRTSPIVAGLFLVPIVVNLAHFDAYGWFSDASQQDQEQLIAALAYSEEAKTVPPYVRPTGWLTIGWLREVAAQHRLPEPKEIPSRIRQQIPLLLGVAQRKGPPPSSRCDILAQGTPLEARKGEVFGFRFDRRPPPGTNFLVGNSLVVTRVSPEGRPISSVVFKPDFGQVIEITLDDLSLRLSAAEPSQRVVLCR